MTEAKKIEVECPKCGTKREIKGTEERVRCPNKEKCGFRYYTQKNLVPFIGTPLKIDQTPINTHTDKKGNITIDGPSTSILVGLEESSDFKRLMYLALMGESWRGTNANLDRILKHNIKKLRAA